MGRANWVWEARSTDVQIAKGRRERGLLIQPCLGSMDSFYGTDVANFLIQRQKSTPSAGSAIRTNKNDSNAVDARPQPRIRGTSPTSKNEFEPFMAQKWHFLIRRQESTPTRSNKNCPNMLPSHVNLNRHESTTRLRLCSSCSKSLKSGSAVLMALDQPFCSERCRSEFVFTQAEPTSEPHSRTYRQRSEGQGVFISDPKRSKDSPQSPREFIQLYPVTQPRWSESSLAT